MASPILTPALVRLRSGFNLIAPSRDKASDGWIGDRAHQDSRSGHNPDESGNAERQDADRIDEVRALDVDKDLRRSGLTMQQCVQRILDTPNDRKRLIYIIWNRTIWSASNGWKPRAYTGSNPHTQHAHFSGHPDYDNDDRPWGIEQLVEDDMEQTDKLRYKTAYPNRVIGQTLADLHNLRDWLHGSPSPVNPPMAGSPLRRLEQLLQQWPALVAEVTALSGRDPLDEQRVVDGVLAGLGAKDLDDAVAALRAAFGDRAGELAARLAAATGAPDGQARE